MTTNPHTIAARMALLACAALLTPLMIWPAARAATAQAETETAAARDYAIAGGTLTEVLARFAEASGVTLSFDPRLTDGKTSAGLQGRYRLDQAFEHLLGPQGLRAVRKDRAWHLEAAPPASATQLAPVRVQAEAEQGSASEDSDAYTISTTHSATGLELAPRDTPQSVSVITHERIDDQAMRTVAEALRATPGVSLKATDRGRNDLSVRGFTVNNFQLDGIPVATGNVGIETTSTVIYDRVEVVRGATGLLSGAGEPSAAVNLVRKHADSPVFTGSASVQLGSWDHRGVTVDLSTPLNASASVRARVAAHYDEQDAFIDLERTHNTTVYAIIDADLGERSRLSVGASDQRDDRDGVYWGGLPYFFTDGTRTDWDRSKTTATTWNRWDTHEQTVFAALEHSFDNGWTLRANANHYRQTEESNLLWVTGLPDRETGTGMNAYPYLYRTEPRQNQANALLSGPFTLFGRRHEVLAGAMISRVKSGWDNGGVPLSPIEPVGNFYEWDGSYPAPVWDEPHVGSRETVTQSAGYAAARLQLTDALRLITGARLSRYVRDVEAGAWTPQPYELRENAVFTPYLGVLHELGRHLTAYASYTSIFSAQNLRDRNGDYLDPIDGRGYEAGLKAEFLDGGLQASAALFRIDEENLGVRDGDHVVPGSASPAYRHGQGVKTEGYELELVGRPRPDWDLSLGWTSYSAKDADGEHVAVAHPRRLLKLFSKHELGGALRGLTLGGGINWQGDVPERRTNPASGVVEKVGQPAFALVELLARYRFSKALSAQLNAYNVLDEKYYEGSWGTFTYGEPRSLRVSLDYRF